MIPISVAPVSRDLEAALRVKIDGKAKPVGALGALETVALRLGLVQQTLAPQVERAQLLLFAADHGLSARGVSAYPSEITALMARNFAGGGAAINAFCRLNGWQLRVLNVGVDADLSDVPLVENHVVRRGSRDASMQESLTAAEVEAALQIGFDAAQSAATSGSNVLACGEMGIGNTATAALLMSRLFDFPIEQCAGRGTGLDDAGLARKIEVLRDVLALHAGVPREPCALLRAFGGLEIAAMCGAFIGGAHHGTTLLIDGFIASVALALAIELAPAIADYAILCHLSAERGHARLSERLIEAGALPPLLDLGLRLGEGTGAALALPLVRASVTFLNEMADLPGDVGEGAI